MKNNRQEFYDNSLSYFHASLISHDLTEKFLSGKNIKFDRKYLEADDMIELIMEDRIFSMDAIDFYRLFLVLNNSRVHRQELPARKGVHEQSPRGLYITTKIYNASVDGGVKNSVGIFLQKSDGEKNSGEAGLIINGMHIHNFMINESSPETLGTIAFSLSAITAYQQNINKIQLIAAGGENYNSNHIGYFVWPKYGFDASLEDGETDSWPETFNSCKSVQDVINIDENFWRKHGSQRLMTFDLSPGSASWAKLLEYTLGKQLWSKP